LRSIQIHEKGVLQLLGGKRGLMVGMRIFMYPGCDYSKECCAKKFNNIINMKAVPHLQGESLFDGNPKY